VFFRDAREGARKPAHVDRLGFLHPAVLYRERRGVRSAVAVVESRNIGRLLLFTLAFLLIRIAPLGIYKNALAKNDLPALALLSSTTLPLVVAITYLGRQTGQMTAENASALVGAAIVTVTLFPMLANMVRTPSAEARSNAIVAAFANRIVAWSLGRVSNLLVLLPIQPLKSRETKIIFPNESSVRAYPLSPALGVAGGERIELDYAAARELTRSAA